MYYIAIAYNIYRLQMRKNPRIGLIHATTVAVQPIMESFGRLWPEAMVYNLLEDSLTADLLRADGDSAAMAPRFSNLVRYVLDAGADGVLFTCSAFGPAIDRARAATSQPVLKPNEAMIEEAIASGTRIALVATFEPALAPITNEFHDSATQHGIELDLSQWFVADALAALHAGDHDRHDQLIAETCKRAADSDVICFAQFSMTSAQVSAQNASGRPVLTTPDSAVKKLMTLLNE